MLTVYGYEVLEAQPDDGQDRARNYTRTQIIFDAATGKLRANDRSGVALVKPEGFRWVMEGRAEIQDYRDWLDRGRGACAAFWLPGRKHDLVVTQDVTANVAGLQIANQGYTRLQFPDRARRYLALYALDGTRRAFYRKVTAAVEGGSTEALTLDTAVITTGTIPVDQVMASFLTLVRLAVDDPELIWNSRDCAEVTLPFVELPLEVPA